MPFYIGACAVFYYMPYMLFRIINTDIISLRTAVKSSGFSDTDGIIKNYFDVKINPLLHQYLRVRKSCLIYPNKCEKYMICLPTEEDRRGSANFFV